MLHRIHLKPNLIHPYNLILTDGPELLVKEEKDEKETDENEDKGKNKEKEEEMEWKRRGGEKIIKERRM